MNLELTIVEQQLLDSSAADFQKAMVEEQRVGEILKQKHEYTVGLGIAMEKVFKTILILKGANPDAYTADWSSDTGRVSVKEKESSAAAVTARVPGVPIPPLPDEPTAVEPGVVASNGKAKRERKHAT